MSDEVCGVYMLFRRKRLVYVGRSKNPEKRIQSHRRNGRAFDYSIAIPCPPGDVDWIERAMIEALNPPQNRNGVVTPREEGPDEIVRVVIKEVEKPAPFAHIFKRDPNRPFAVSSPPLEVSRYGLGKAYKEAIQSGELHSFPAHPDRTGPRSRRLIMQGDFDRWLATKVEDRRGWRA